MSKNISYYKQYLGSFFSPGSVQDLIDGQNDLKLCSLARLAREMDIPAVTVHDGFR